MLPSRSGEGAAAEARHDGRLTARDPRAVVVTFPFPPWATRKEEVDDAAGDPFAGL